MSRILWRLSNVKYAFFSYLSISYFKFLIGQRVQAKSRIAGDHFYNGKIHDIWEDRKSAYILFDNGEIRPETPLADIRIPQDLRSDVCFVSVTLVVYSSDRRAAAAAAVKAILTI